MKLIVLLIVVLSSFLSFAQQPTIGLRLSSSQASDGYTLFTPEKNNLVHLIDNCGEVINTWEFTQSPTLTCYLLENGNLLRAGADSLEIRDWNNQLIWSYSTSLNGFPQHHDIEPLPDGNILLVSKESFDATELVALGRNPALGNSTFVTDVIYELQPIGSNNAQLVWQWKFSDHFIQEFDNTKSNYGTVSNFPELLDINFDNSQQSDYTHVNAIDYNADLDQILITSRYLSEVLIIDHSTTLMEAAGHAGGASGKGGDFLFRWGNPQVYQGGNADDQLLHWPHDGKWVNNGYPNEGKLTVFNNFGDGISLASSVHVFAPVIVNNVYQMDNNMFLPSNYFWSWGGSVMGEVVFEYKKSGMMELQNGNHLVCTNSNGTLFEVDQNDDVIWVYKNPSGPSNVIYQQNEIVPNNSNVIFRGERYPSDFLGFNGKNMTPTGTLENSNSLSTACSTAGIESKSTDVILFENPITNQEITFYETLKCDKLSVVNLNGETVISIINFEGNSLTISNKPGIYFLNVVIGQEIISSKVIVL